MSSVIKLGDKEKIQQNRVSESTCQRSPHSTIILQQLYEVGERHTWGRNAKGNLSITSDIVPFKINCINRLQFNVLHYKMGPTGEFRKLTHHTCIENCV